MAGRTPTTAAVLGSTRQLGVTLVRALSSAGYRVIGLDDRRMPLELYSRFAQAHHCYRATTPAEEVECILKFLREQRPSVLIAARITPVVAEHAEEFARFTSLLAPPPAALARITDKPTLYEMCRRIGIAAPGVLAAEEARETLQSRPEEARAVIVKPRSDIGGGNGISLVRRVEDLEPALRATEERYGAAFVSEFIPGPREDIVALNLLFDRESRLVEHFAFRKIRLFPPETGVTAAARSVYLPELLEQVLPLFERIGWRGPADVEYKIDSRSGVPTMLEINGRFTGALSFSIGCGVNFPALACEAALGQNTVSDLAPSYPQGQLYWHPYLFARSLWLDAAANGRPWATFRDGLRAVRGRKVGSPWMLSDMGPVAGKLLLAARSRLARVILPVSKT